MEYTVTTDIDAAPDAVWQILADVEHWPEWTASMTSIDRLDEGPLAVGSRARVKQPKLPIANFVVTDLQPGASFEWTSKRAGMTSVGDHRIAPRGAGSQVKLTFRMTGALAPLVSVFSGKLIREYVDTEAAGLKRRAESS
jgi:carbon monoxide dehydrogenase subunit G